MEQGVGTMPDVLDVAVKVVDFREEARGCLLLAQAEFWLRGLASWIPTQDWPQADSDR